MSVKDDAARAATVREAYALIRGYTAREVGYSWGYGNAGAPWFAAGNPSGSVGARGDAALMCALEIMFRFLRDSPATRSRLLSQGGLKPLPKPRKSDTAKKSTRT